MFKEIDLSRAVPRNAVAITFRYRITRGADDVPPVARLADNAHGRDPVLLAGESGSATIRLRTAQRLYYEVDDPQLHLSLWILECRTLTKRSC